MDFMIKYKENMEIQIVGIFLINYLII